MTDWEIDYIDIRKKEGYFFSDDEVRTLPRRPKHDINFSKWAMRQKSTDRMLDYISAKNPAELKILDLGCGNGWFANKLANISPALFVEAWDVNRVELNQAKRIFQRENLCFTFQDVFDKKVTNQFDYIILNSVVQYFPDIGLLLRRLHELLNASGEIHILDSPFYRQSEIAAARKRTKDYYKQLGFSQMADHYYHHDVESLQDFHHEIKYKPSHFLNRIKRKLGMNDSPFMWVMIASENKTYLGG